MKKRIKIMIVFILFMLIFICAIKLHKKYEKQELKNIELSQIIIYTCQNSYLTDATVYSFDGNKLRAMTGSMVIGHNGVVKPIYDGKKINLQIDNEQINNLTIEERSFIERQAEKIINEKNTIVFWRREECFVMEGVMEYI